MLESKNTRKYKLVKTSSENGGEVILLDEKKLKTPEKREIFLPSKELAKAISKEWAIQEKTIKISEMPLTKLCFTAIDKVSPYRFDNIQKLLTWASSDLLCYHVDNNQELIDLQDSLWQPHLDWLELSVGVKLKTTKKMSFINQPKNSIKELEKFLTTLDDFTLVCVIGLVEIFGSIVLSLRVSCGGLDYQRAFKDSMLHEYWQRKKWGDDPEALQRESNILKELESIQKFLLLTKK